MAVDVVCSKAEILLMLVHCLMLLKLCVWLGSVFGPGCVGYCIDVVPITQLRACVMNILHVQWRSHNVVRDFLYYKELLLRKEFAPFGSKFFPLRDVPNLKRGAIEENHCLFQ